MFALTVRFDLKDEAAAKAFDALAAVTATSVRALEPDALVYVPHTVDGEPLARVFYESYRDRAAFDSHAVQSHTELFFAETADLVSGTRIEFLLPLDGASARTD